LAPSTTTVGLLCINRNPGRNYYHLFIGAVILVEEELSDLLLLG
jgi:hypothetical protein